MEFKGNQIYSGTFEGQSVQVQFIKFDGGLEISSPESGAISDWNDGLQEGTLVVQGVGFEIEVSKIGAFKIHAGPFACNAEPSTE